MSYLLGVVIFVVAILVSIMLHEAGHLLTAKAFGMRVTRYFVGFGNTLWSTVRGETEYGIKSIPLGGFVEIMGMSSMDDVDPADEPRSFRAKPGWQRSVVLLAGSATHFLIAFLLLVGLALGIGLASRASNEISVLPCIPAKVATACAPGDPRSPAELAGLRWGDRIVAVAGRPVSNWIEVGKAIRGQKPGKPVPFTIVRGNRQFTMRIALAHASWCSACLGVQPAVPYPRTGPLGAVSYAGSAFGTIVTGTVQSIARRPSELVNVFARNRSSNGGGLSSVVGVGEVTGQVVSANGVSWQDKATFVVLIIAQVNIFVGIFNLLPLLPLDGGKLVIVIFESVRSRLARLRRRPDPGLVDMRKLMPVTVAFLVLVICYGVLLIAADIINPIHIQ
jgi:membrane-associated protease RseP (regulator of RpoE activity)